MGANVSVGGFVSSTYSGVVMVNCNCSANIVENGSGNASGLVNMVVKTAFIQECSVNGSI